VLRAAESLDNWLSECKRKNLYPVTWREKELLHEIRRTGEQLGRTPLKKEIPEKIRCKLRICYGTWDAVIQAAGFIPLEGKALEQAQWDYEQHKSAGSGKLYRIQDLELQYTAMLEELAVLAKRLGRVPLKDEIEPEKRILLLKRCGSWRNALYQIGISAMNKQETAKIKSQKRRFNKESQRTT
jgi:hypothetical protein